jgi:preprotein translocase subunit SecB
VAYRHPKPRLRQAIKQTVANAGHPDVLLDPFERITQKYATLIAEERTSGQGAAEDVGSES